MARRVVSQPRRKERGLAVSVLTGGAAAAILASWLVIDPRSIDAFEAPKVLMAQAGIALAAGAALWRRLVRPERRPLVENGAPAIVLALFGAGLLGAVASAALSRHPARSFDTLRSAAPFLLALGVGAALVSVKRFSTIETIFIAGATINALLAFLAARNLFSPLVVLGRVKRAAFGALLGNPGHLGIALALAAVAVLPRAIAGRGRWPARAALGAILAGILATQTLSGLAALAVGTAAYLVPRFGRRAAIPIMVFLLLLGGAAMRSRQIRFRVYFAQRSLRRGDWNSALSARAAPWLAGAEMIRAHPWLGIGPGNFAGEFVPRRLDAEARHRLRLVVAGMENNSFSEAHCDYLEILAAIGIPAGLCLISAWLLIVLLVISRGRGDPEAAAAGASLAAGAVAAATWFPFQIAAPAVWLLLLTGASFRFIAPAKIGEQR